MITALEVLLRLLFMLLVPTVFIFLFFVVISTLPNTYIFPYYRQVIDVTGKRNVDVSEIVDRWLLEYGMGDLEQHLYRVEGWKKECEDSIHGIFASIKRRQYESVLTDAPFVFILVRKHTRYRQKNYIKEAYITTDTEEVCAYSWDMLADRYAMLAKIGFQTTAKQYFSNNQRKYMTQALRRRIMERDDYTCQLCGKYMPDGVGLHIDHIIPVSKGGLSVESNLQVLCSKCNLHKSDKIEGGVE